MDLKLPWKQVVQPIYEELCVHLGSLEIAAEGHLTISELHNHS